MGPAVVDPCAVLISEPPTTWPFRVFHWPRALAPAIMDAVERLGVYPMNHTVRFSLIVPGFAADSWFRASPAPPPNPSGAWTPRRMSLTASATAGFISRRQIGP